MNNILDALAKKYEIDKRIGDNNHGYTEIYFDLLKEKRDQIEKVMEIGVWKGGSLRMWRDYFPFAEVIGLDNHSELLFEADRIKCFYAEQNEPETLIEAVKNCGKFDLIVDDGSHVLVHQLSSFKNLFPFIKEGGMYAIEDVFIETLDQVKEELKDYSFKVYPSQIAPFRYQGTDIFFTYNLVIISK